MDLTNLKVSSSPHIRNSENTSSIMLDVIIALCPALIVGTYMFGFRAFLMTIISAAACVLFEFLYRLILKKPASIGDLSAIVTGMLIAFCLPSTMPFWAVIVGDLFAIVVVKQLYGGIGKNFLNPALAARAFMMACWPVEMTTWVKPLSYTNFWDLSTVDVVTSATPLSFLHVGELSNDFSVVQVFLGHVGGTIGEISALVLLCGGIYLVLRRVINLRIPLSYILTVAVITFIFPQGNDNLRWMLFNIFSGGLMLGAIFMATDYCTSPVTPWGQVIFGIGCGLITVFIRYFGSYSEGVSYAILIMNATVWLIDKISMPKRFGLKKFKKDGDVK